MITKIRQKCRALVNDFSLSSSESFTYVSSSIFTIAESNITITQVTKNGVATSSYTYSSTTGKITISATLVVGDVIECSYTYNKYSNTEIDEYIRAALVWISIFSDNTTDYEIESGGIFEPTPSNREADLIAIVASILINPDCSQYKLPTVSVVYNGRIPKEQKIEKLLNKFNHSKGVSELIEYNVSINE